MLVSEARSIRVTMNKMHDGTWSWSYHVDGESNGGEGSRSTAWGSANCISDVWDAVEGLLPLNSGPNPVDDDVENDELPPAPFALASVKLSPEKAGDIIDFVHNRPGVNLTDIRRFMKKCMSPSDVSQSLEYLVSKNALCREYKRANKIGRRTYYYYPSGK